MDIRIGHAEREAAVNGLQTAFGEGRLDVAEFDERVASVYAARTAGELLPLTADLPAVSPAESVAPRTADTTALPVKGDSSGRALGWAWRAWATAVSINLAIWVLVSLSNQEAVYFWPIWVAGPWGAVLLASTVFRNAERQNSPS